MQLKTHTLLLQILFLVQIHHALYSNTEDGQISTTPSSTYRGIVGNSTDQRERNEDWYELSPMPSYLSPPEYSSSVSFPYFSPIQRSKRGTRPRSSKKNFRRTKKKLTKLRNRVKLKKKKSRLNMKQRKKQRKRRRSKKGGRQETKRRKKRRKKRQHKTDGSASIEKPRESDKSRAASTDIFIPSSKNDEAQDTFSIVTKEVDATKDIEKSFVYKFVDDSQENMKNEDEIYTKPVPVNIQFFNGQNDELDDDFLVEVGSGLSPESTSPELESPSIDEMIESSGYDTEKAFSQPDVDIDKRLRMNRERTNNFQPQPQYQPKPQPQHPPEHQPNEPNDNISPTTTKVTQTEFSERVNSSNINKTIKDYTNELKNKKEKFNRITLMEGLDLSSTTDSTLSEPNRSNILPSPVDEHSRSSSERYNNFRGENDKVNIVLLPETSKYDTNENTERESTEKLREEENFNDEELNIKSGSAEVENDGSDSHSYSKQEVDDYNDDYGFKQYEYDYNYYDDENSVQNRFSEILLPPKQHMERNKDSITAKKRPELPTGYIEKAKSIMSTDNAEVKFEEVDESAVNFTALDLSCLRMLGEGSMPRIIPPSIKHGHVRTFSRVANHAAPNNVYLEATYACIGGFRMRKSVHKRVFCSESRWIGVLPVCEAQDKQQLNKLCSRDENQCRRLCHSKPNGELQCNCFEGYEEDDERTNYCKDIDECQLNTTRCEDVCFNLEGSYQCYCPSGYRRSTETSQPTCVDVNECLLRNGHGPCQDTCTNTEGGFICSCQGIPGTRLADDGVSCADVDECQQNNGGCSHDCVSTIGHVFCSCPDGFLLGDDWKNCIDLDECAVDNGKCEDLCVNTVGSYHCGCNNASACVTRAPVTCSDNNGNCQQRCQAIEGGGVTCSCHPGYFLADDKHTCLDVDECEGAGAESCDQECVNTPGSYTCGCYDGYHVSSSDATMCEPDDRCALDNGGCSHVCVPSVGISSRREYAGVVCQCPSGWRLDIDGATCLDIDECTSGSGSCDQLCENVVGGFRCLCRGGYRLLSDNSTCADIDECRDNSSVCYSDVKEMRGGGGEGGDGRASECVNTQGSYHCTCHPGFRLVTRDNDGRQMCVDIDECRDERSPNNGGCSHVCENRVGGHVCSCPAGLRLSVDARSCVDIDECADASLNACDFACRNTPGGYRCVCPAGMTLLPGSETVCGDVDECATNGTHQCDHMCENTAGSYRCRCRRGFELATDGRHCVRVDACSDNNAGCDHACVTDESGAAVCTCRRGFRLAPDGTSCVDVDECAMGSTDSPVCPQLCSNTPGSFLCGCLQGFRLARDGIQCVDINECDEGNTSAICSDLCVNTEGGYHCECSDGMRLLADNITCTDIPSCLNNNSSESHRGDFACEQICDDSGGEVRCNCHSGYRLQSDRRSCGDVDECADGENGGCQHTCVNTLGGRECLCPVGFSLSANGTHCRDTDECASDNGGCSDECVNTAGGRLCLCPPGFRLSDDGALCVDIDECTADEGNGGCSHACVNTRGSRQCTCPVGFRLGADSATCEDMDECLISEEKHSDANITVVRGSNLTGVLCEQLCINTAGSFVCACLPGFELTPGSAGRCDDVDECSDDKNHMCEHECSNTDGSYLCVCAPGYRLGEDGRSCTDIDECQESGSGQEGCSHLCRNLPGSFRCECPAGWRLSSDGVTCADIDECLESGTDKAGCSHECVNTDGSYRCRCDRGFMLDPANDHQCVDIDECASSGGDISPSSSSTTNHCSHQCENTPGGYRCLCPQGYQLETDNRTCTSADPCVVGNGGCSHVCRDSYGVATCRCPEGWILTADMHRCVDVDECSRQETVCAQLCVNIAGSYRCECRSGFRLASNGHDCVPDSSIGIDDVCAVGNGGCDHVCTNVDGVARCSCMPGYRPVHGGALCRDFDECARENGGCQHVCVNTLGSRQCACRIGHQLTPDGVTCQVVDPCMVAAVSSTGGCSHQCVPGSKPGQFVCLCPAGYRLATDQRTCLDIDECETGAGLLCSDSCDNFRGGFRCGCRQGRHLSSDNRTCVDIDECRLDNGQCNQLCINTDPGRVCACRAGFRLGLADGVSCWPVDVCRAGNGSVCSHSCSVSSSDGSPVCHCPPGYRLGVDRRTCIDIDECVDGRNGGCDQECENTAGGRVCSCRPGFAVAGVDGGACEDIDECAVNNGECQHRCENRAGGFVCRCNAGFRPSWRDKRMCRDINECAFANGGCSHRCVNQVGGYLCTCADNFQLSSDNHTCLPVVSGGWCPPPTAPPHSDLICDKQLVSGAGFPEGTECRTRCRHGQISRGATLTVCGRQGVWLGQPAHCTGIGGEQVPSCSAIAPPPDATLRPHRCLRGTTSPGRRCYVVCMPGFKLAGRARLTCQYDLSWTFEGRRQPRCVPRAASRRYRQGAPWWHQYQRRRRLLGGNGMIDKPVIQYATIEIRSVPGPNAAVEDDHMDSYSFNPSNQRVS